ncbi:MAG: XTP/dITP diphosphatase [Planctomycetes bacterium]|nr:XTP/dITP diphosphatase [Planctomycetota bacterium]
MTPAGKPTVSVRLLIATTNPGKLREVRAMLEGLLVQVVTLDDFPSLPVPIEDQETFEANARLKALHYARLTDCLTLADDSGLEVDALGGAPGVHSARYAGGACDTAANNAKLVAALSGVEPQRRTARFRCAMALARGDRILATAAGKIEGVIVDEPRGHNGFGYDPHFLVPDCGLTAAEMPSEQKNRISHRGRALQAIRPAIEQIVLG